MLWVNKLSATLSKRAYFFSLEDLFQNVSIVNEVSEAGARN